MAKVVDDRLFYLPIVSPGWRGAGEISDKVQVSLALLTGLGESDDKLKLVKVDSDGQLKISGGTTSKSVFETVQVSVTDSATQIFPTNSDRTEISITNFGSNTVYVGKNNLVTATTGYPITPGSTVVLSNYIGAMYGICDSGSTSDIATLEIE